MLSSNVKNFENRLRVDKVTDSLKVGTFWRRRWVNTNCVPAEIVVLFVANRPLCRFSTGRDKSGIIRGRPMAMAWNV